jgi:hypothetical protein
LAGPTLQRLSNRFYPLGKVKIFLPGIHQRG